MTDYCKFWDNRIIEAIFKINRGNLIILGLYAPAEGRKELLSITTRNKR